ncbi:MAG: metallophosphoesterase [Vulcanococcus sp.]|jgi:serine/threonine protein phosphatase 1
MTSVSRRLHHWVIGDVHGCAGSLEDLLATLPAGDRLIFCGDAINRGPAIGATMERIWGLVEQGRAVWLRGNHEQDLITALRGGSWQADRSLAGCDTFRHLGEQACRRWLERLEHLPLAYWGDGWVATHAGFDPETWQPDLRVRLGFWQHYDGRFGEVIIGHTPGPHVRRLPQIVMVDTGACYGGALSAYCPETREVISVPGLRPEAPRTLPGLRAPLVSPAAPAGG